jgi:SAM-dependent methyltransferase
LKKSSSRENVILSAVKNPASCRRQARVNAQAGVDANSLTPERRQDAATDLVLKKPAMKMLTTLLATSERGAELPDEMLPKKRQGFARYLCSTVAACRETKDEGPGCIRVNNDHGEKGTGDKRAALARSRGLSTEKAVCGICGSEDDTLPFARNIERSGDFYDVSFCSHCQVGFTVPFPSDEVLSRLYSSGSYRSNDGTRFNAFAEFLVRYFNTGKKRNLKKYHQNEGALLDVGCGRGLFLDIMKRDGWRVTGVEFNEETASYARIRYGLDVITIHALTGLPDESYDVITLYHVLEHMPDPAAVLRTCGRLLKKHGLLVIAVPNISSLQAALGKSNWFHLDIPYHLHHFTPGGLRRLLDNPLKIVNVQQFDFEQNVFGWMQTLLNTSGIKNNLLYNLLKKPELRRSELATARKRDLLLTVLLAPVFLPLSIILSLFESLVLRRGGTIQMYALKQ